LKLSLGKFVLTAVEIQVMSPSKVIERVVPKDHQAQVRSAAAKELL